MHVSKYIPNTHTHTLTPRRTHKLAQNIVDVLNHVDRGYRMDVPDPDQRKECWDKKAIQ